MSCGFNPFCLFCVQRKHFFIFTATVSQFQVSYYLTLNAYSANELWCRHRCSKQHHNIYLFYWEHIVIVNLYINVHIYVYINICMCVFVILLNFLICFIFDTLTFWLIASIFLKVVVFFYPKLTTIIQTIRFEGLELWSHYPVIIISIVTRCEGKGARKFNCCFTITMMLG